MTAVVLPYPVMSVQRKSCSPRVRVTPSPRNERPFTSFLIKDILNKEPGPGDHHYPGVPTTLDYIRNKLCPVMPRGVATESALWVAGERLLLARPRPVNHAAVAAATVAFTNEAKKGADKGTAAAAGLLGRADSPDAPLTALEQLTTKTFTGLETSILKAAEAAASGGKRDSLHLLSRQAPRKKRKSRTAFTNHQIFELERRFLYQKYLNPADRDELASTLGLTNAQVITWFQNRRAKLKRDFDELKADLSSKDEDEEEEAEMRRMGMKRKVASSDDNPHVKVKLEKVQHFTEHMRANLPAPLLSTGEAKKRLELRRDAAAEVRDLRIPERGLEDDDSGTYSERLSPTGDSGRSSDGCGNVSDSQSDADDECPRAQQVRGRHGEEGDEEDIDVENIGDGHDDHIDHVDHGRYHSASPGSPPTRSKSC